MLEILKAFFSIASLPSLSFLSCSVSLHLVLFCPSPSLGLSHLHLSCLNSPSLLHFHPLPLTVSIFLFLSCYVSFCLCLSLSFSTLSPFSLCIISACVIYMYNNLIQGNSRQFLSLGHSLPCILTIVSRFNIIDVGLWMGTIWISYSYVIYNQD